MAKQELDAILAAEQEAAETVERAKARAREILDHAEREASQMLKAVEAEARKQADLIHKNASDGAVAVEQKARVKAESEIARLRDQAEIRADQAVKMVVLRVKESL